MVEVGRQMMKAEQTFISPFTVTEVIRPTEFAKMMHIRKERYSRRHAGKHVVWLVADKYQQYLLGPAFVLARSRRCAAAPLAMLHSQWPVIDIATMCRAPGRRHQHH